MKKSIRHARESNSVDLAPCMYLKFKTTKLGFEG
jgi:hypothetical protein